MLAVAALVAALVCAFAPVSGPQAANAAAGDPFPSGAAAIYLSQHQPTQLYQGRQTAGTIGFTAIGSASSIPYNAIGFRASDHYIYAMENRQASQTNQLLRIGRNGGVQSLGAVANIGMAHYNQGTFGSGSTADTFYIRASSLNDRLYAIDMASPSRNGEYSARTITLKTQVPNVSDILWKDGYIWGVWAPSGVSASIYRIDPNDGGVQQFFLGTLIPRNVSYGAQWRYGNDNIGLLSNANGNVYQLSVTNPASADPTFALVSSLSGLAASNNNDGTDYPGDPVDLGIEKTADPYFAPGGQFTYTLTVTNHSTIDSSGFTIRDPLPEGITTATSPTAGCSVQDHVLVCVLGALAHGASTTVTVSATAAANAAGCITNTATVIGNEEDDVPGNDTSSAESCAVQPRPAFTVSKTSTPTVVHPGDTVKYTVTVTNVGNTDFTASSPASFTDDLSDVVDGATFNDDATNGATWNASTATLSWQGPLDIGETTRVTYSVTVKNPLPDGINGRVINSVTPGTNGSCDPTGVCTTDIPVSSFTVVKSAAPSPASVDGAVVFSFTVTNTGHVATNASFTDDLSQIMQYATIDTGSATGGLVIDGSTANWSGTLEPGATETVTFTATGIAADAVGVGLHNSVVTPPDSGGNCPDGTTNADCTVDVPVTVAPLKAFKVSKTVSTPQGNGTAVPGDTVTYTVSVTNTGNVDFDESAGLASFTDDLSGVLNDASNVIAAAPLTFANGIVSWSGELTVGETLHFTYTVTVDSPVPTGATGHLVNTVTTTDPGSCVTAASCTTSVPVLAYSVAKTASSSVAELVQSVTYTVTVSNIGAEDFTTDMPATFSDDLSGVLDDATLTGVPAGATFDASTGVLTWNGAVPTHDSVSVSYTVHVNAPASGDGTMTNTVTTPPDGNCATGAEPGCSVTVLIPAFTVSKSASPSTVHAGDTVTYTLTVNALRASFTSASAVVTDDLTGVLDDATYNGDASPAATYEDGVLTWHLQPTVGTPIVITYSVTARGDRQGDNMLTNTVSADAETGGSCAPNASCTSEVPLAYFTVMKGVDPETAQPGDVVTYSISITNFSSVPFTAQQPASLSDDLSRILQSATFNDDATNGAVFDSRTGILYWTGPLAAGETVLVTFSITIDDDAAAGTLHNVAVTPDDTGGNCPQSTDNVACAATAEIVVTPPGPTPTPTPPSTPAPAQPSLPGTGSNVWPLAAGGLLALIAGAIALALTARRRGRA